MDIQAVISSFHCYDHPNGRGHDIFETRNSEEFTGGAESLTFPSPYPAVKTKSDIKLF